MAKTKNRNKPILSLVNTSHPTLTTAHAGCSKISQNIQLIGTQRTANVQFSIFLDFDDTFGSIVYLPRQSSYAVLIPYWPEINAQLSVLVPVLPISVWVPFFIRGTRRFVSMSKSFRDHFEKFCAFHRCNLLGNTNRLIYDIRVDTDCTQGPQEYRPPPFSHPEPLVVRSICHSELISDICLVHVVVCIHHLDT